MPVSILYTEGTIAKVLTLDIYENAFRFQNMGWASAMSLILFGMILVVTLVQFRLLRTDWEY